MFTINATTLRNHVLENRFELNRLNAETLGKDNYKALTELYRNALDALTEWAAKDYSHTSVKEDSDPSFNAVKAILALYETDDNRIVIDQSSMRTMRDCATKPKRLYSDEYTKAMKAQKLAAKTMLERYNDLITLGAPEMTEGEDAGKWVQSILDSDLNVTVSNVNMAEMFHTAVAVHAVKTKAVEDIKAAGHYTWKRPVAVSLNEFADLIENYVGDCLEEGYNIKPTKIIREEQAAARKAARANA